MTSEIHKCNLCCSQRHGPIGDQIELRCCASRVPNIEIFASSPRIIAQVEIMIEDIRNSFKNLLNEATWLDKDTAILAKEKVGLITSYTCT